MNNKVRVGVIGCGRQAWLGYFPWISENPNAELAAIADVDEGLLKKTGEKFKAGKTYTDWEEMIEDGDMEAVVIVTPPWIHAGPAIAAAKKGIHVICEKPLATTVEDCERMAEAAESAGIIFSTAHSLRFDPGYEKLKRMIRSGSIGRVFQLRATYDSWIPDLSKSPAKEIMDFGKRIRIFQSSDMGTWRHSDKRTNGGVFFDHGIHYVDMFRWLMDEEVVDVNGVVQKINSEIEYEDHGSALLKFESGACAYVQGSQVRFSSRFTCDEGLISGEKGCLRYNMDQAWYIMGFPYLNRTHCSVWQYNMPAFVLGKWLPVEVKHGRKHCMFKRQFDTFISKITGDFIPHPDLGNWAATVRDGLENVRIVHKVYETSNRV